MASGIPTRSEANLTQMVTEGTADPHVEAGQIQKNTLLRKSSGSARSRPARNSLRRRRATTDRVYQHSINNKCTSVVAAVVLRSVDGLNDAFGKQPCPVQLPSP